jgi:hypothetical protein
MPHAVALSPPRRRGHARRSRTRFTILTIDTPGTDYGERYKGELTSACAPVSTTHGVERVRRAFRASAKNSSIFVHARSPMTPRIETPSFSYNRRTIFTTFGEALIVTGGSL